MDWSKILLNPLIINCFLQHVHTFREWSILMMINKTFYQKIMVEQCCTHLDLSVTKKNMNRILSLLSTRFYHYQNLLSLTIYWDENCNPTDHTWHVYKTFVDQQTRLTNLVFKSIDSRYPLYAPNTHVLKKLPSSLKCLRIHNMRLTNKDVNDMTVLVPHLHDLGLCAIKSEHSVMSSLTQMLNKALCLRTLDMSHTDVDIIMIDHLTSSLPNMHHLHTIKFCKSRLDTYYLHKLSNTLTACKTLTRLYIHNDLDDYRSCFTKNTYTDVSSTLISCSNLIYLNVKQTNLFEGPHDQLADAFTSLSRLTWVDFSETGITKDACNVLGKALSHWHQLDTLVLAKNPIGAQGWHGLVTHFTTLSHLRTLDLSSTQMNQKNINMFACRCLPCMTQLETINISDNLLGIGAGTLFEKLSQYCTRLVTLDLQSTHIKLHQTHGIENLSFPSLVTLSMSHNPLHMCDFNAIKYWHLPCVRYWYMNFCQLNAGACKPLSMILQTCKNLQILELYDNQIGWYAWQHLQHAFLNLKSLKTLCMGRNKIDSATANTMISTLSTLSNLIHLNLQQNQIDDRAQPFIHDVYKMTHLKRLNLQHNLFLDQSFDMDAYNTCSCCHYWKLHICRNVNQSLTQTLFSKIYDTTSRWMGIF